MRRVRPTTVRGPDGHPMHYVGELCALGTALSWALSGIFFGSAARRVGGFATNHFRIWAALLLLGLVVLLTEGRFWPADLTDNAAWLLLLSGVVGLVIGDIGYFHALATIGPRLAAVLMATWPLMALALGPVIGEPFQAATLPGILLTVVGVVLVLWRGKESSGWNANVTARQRWSGIAGGFLAAFGQAGGVILARMAFADAEIPSHSATLVRLLAAVPALQIMAIVYRQPFAGTAVTRDRRALVGALLGTVVGPVVGVWMSMVATQWSANVGVASALMATAPLFMVPLARIAYGSRPGVLGWIGTCLTVAGAMWLLL